MILPYMTKRWRTSVNSEENGWLVQDDKENYYIYAQTMNGRTQYGFVVGAWVPDYMEGRIRNMSSQDATRKKTA